MPLTDEQWTLIAPLLPPPSPGPGGRPPIADRPILDAVLYKLATGLPWYDLPISDPSWQTCYRRYRLWLRLGLLPKIYRLLYLDLRDRGGFDFLQALQDRRVSIISKAGRLVYPPELAGRWQGYTVILLISYIFQRCQPPRRHRLFHPLLTR